MENYFCILRLYENFQKSIPQHGKSAVNPIIQREYFIPLSPGVRLFHPRAVHTFHSDHFWSDELLFYHNKVGYLELLKGHREGLKNLPGHTFGNLLYMCLMILVAEDFKIT